MPGFIFSRLTGEKRIERLPASEIPESIRGQDRNLAAQPIVRLLWDRYILSFGDGMFGIACQLPYPGWTGFRDQILFFVDLVVQSGVPAEISRFDVRYVDLIDGSDPKALGAKLDASVVLGGVSLTDRPLHLKTVLDQGSMQHHVTLTFPSKLRVGPAAAVRQGLLLIVNTRVGVVCAVSEFMELLRDRIDEVHHANKSTFFLA